MSEFVSTLELLPQASSAIISNTKMRSDVINLLYGLLESLCMALRAFYFEKSYINFDAHVGDTACQIRAAILLNIIKKNRKNKYILYRKAKRINEIKKICQELILTWEESQLYPVEFSNHSVTLDEFLKEIKGWHLVENDENFLLGTYFLTKYKAVERDGSTYIDYVRISNEMNITRKLAKKLTRHFQLEIARESCKKIIEWSHKLYFSHAVTNALQKLYCHDDDNRTVLPCYLLNKILLENLNLKKTPILVVARRKRLSGEARTCMIFSPVSHEALAESYVLEKFDHYMDVPCFIIEGQQACQKNETEDSSQLYAFRLMKEGIASIVLANMAAHPQYSGAKLAVYKQNPFLFLEEKDITRQIYEPELAAMREKAFKIGCCKENPALFYIDHVYCDIPKHILQRWTDLKVEIINPVECDRKEQWLDQVMVNV